jgi:hypothetical protein
MSSVKTLGINTVYMTHAAGEIAMGCLYQKVIMVGHQAVTRNFQTKEFGRFFNYLQEKLIILHGEKNVLISSPTVHYMIPTTGIFYP